MDRFLRTLSQLESGIDIYTAANKEPDILRSLLYRVFKEGRYHAQTYNKDNAISEILLADSRVDQFLQVPGKRYDEENGGNADRNPEP